MRRLNPKSRLSNQVPVRAGGLCPEMGTARRRTGFRNPAQCENTQKSWEQSQGVVENKGFHILERAKMNPIVSVKCTDRDLESRAFLSLTNPALHQEDCC